MALMLALAIGCDCLSPAEQQQIVASNGGIETLGQVHPVVHVFVPRARNSQSGLLKAAILTSRLFHQLI